MAAGSRRPLEEAFFDELKEWSEIKLRILTNYFDAYRRFRGSRNPVIYYVDGFAGTGFYGQEEDSGEGSPVRMARMAQSIAEQGKPYRLKCINVELDVENHAKLRRALGPFDPELVEVKQGAFEDHLGGILRTTQSYPVVFFLDAFGPKPITVNALRPVLRRPDTELLINLNTRRLWMMTGFQNSNAKDRSAKLRLISETLGDDPTDPNPRWLQERFRTADPAKWQEWAATAYMKRLQQENPRLQFALNYPVKESFRSNPKYHLVFLTRSKDAVLVMNDLLCTEDEKLFAKTEAVHKGGQFTFWGLLKPDEDAGQFAALVEDIHAYGKTHQGSCLEDITWHFVRIHFGEFKKKHYRHAVKQLLTASRARRSGRTGLSPDHDPLTFI